jgi:hypothetical protein
MHDVLDVDFRELRTETARKGVRATLRAWIWQVYGGQNEPKSTLSVTPKATLQARPRLFGQFPGEVRRIHLLGSSSSVNSEGRSGAKIAVPKTIVFGTGAKPPSISEGSVRTHREAHRAVDEGVRRLGEVRRLHLL